MKSIKRSLLLSVLSMFLCCLLLVGTTFAWFTDSVTNTENVITAGNLSIEAVAYELDMTNTTGTAYRIGVVNNGENFYFKATGQSLKEKDCPPIIDDELWEPGKTNAKLLEVKNTGNLAAKIKLAFDVKSTGLMDALWFDFVQIDAEGNVTGSFTKRPMSQIETIANNLEFKLAADGGNVRFILVYGMYEEAGNEYMNQSFSADVTILATQDTAESDGFGDNQYDAAAKYAVSVSTAGELSSAIAEGKPVSLSENITLTDKIVATGDVTIFGNGNTISVPAGVDRVLDLSNTTDPVTVSLVGVDLQGPTTGTYTRGIPLYNNSSPVTLIMDDCGVSANYYAINVASANEKVDLTIRNSVITGWCAFQTHSPNVNVTFENCILSGINDKGYNADGWNNFATIVINAWSDGNPDSEGAHDCTLSFKNCRIEATQTTGNKQYLLSVRAENTTVNVENCTFYIDGEQIESTLNSVAPHIAVTSDEIAESLTVNFK